jgi:hypothetical protein
LERERNMRMNAEIWERDGKSAAAVKGDGTAALDRRMPRRRWTSDFSL